MSRRTNRLWSGVSVAACAAGGLLAANTASAVTIRDDQVASAKFTAPSTATYPSVGLNGYGVADTTSGVLVAPDWVLTAAHSFTFNPTLNTFTLPNGNTYDVVPGSFTFEPTGADLVLFKITPQPAGPALPGASQVATLYTSTLELGNTSTNIGYGRGGIGSTGETPATFPANVRRGGENVIDRYGILNGTNIDITTDPSGAQYLVEDFDNPASPSSANDLGGAVTAFESGLGLGDSGSGLFFDDGGVPKLAGIFVARGENGTGGYGDLLIAERVSPRVPWIQSVVPEPGSATLITLAASAALVRRRRRLAEGRA